MVGRDVIPVVNHWLREQKFPNELYTGVLIYTVCTVYIFLFFLFFVFNKDVYKFGTITKCWFLIKCCCAFIYSFFKNVNQCWVLLNVSPRSSFFCLRAVPSHKANKPNNKEKEKKAFLYATFMVGWINLRSLNILLLDMSFVVSQARVDERLMAMLRSNLTKGFENSTDRAVVCACDFLVW